MSDDQDETLATVVPLDDSGCIAAYLPCFHCGSNLEGHSFTANCPSCHNPVEYSARADLLHNSPPRYVERLSRGVGFMFIAQLIVGFLIAFAISVFVVTRKTRLEFAASHWVATPLAVLTFMFIFGILLFMAVGTWWVTTPPPWQRDEPFRIDSRRLVRACWPLTLAVSFVASTAHPHEAVVLENLANLLFIIAFAATILHFRSLARRAMAHALAQHDSVFLWVSASVYLLWFVLSNTVVGAEPGAAQPTHDQLGMAALLSSIVHIGLFAWAVVLLNRHYQAFNDAAAASAVNQSRITP